MNREEQWLLEEKYHGEKSTGFFTDCQRLQNGEPLAYIIGSVPFLDCTIFLDSHPLIPRPETEFWVEKALQDIKGAMLEEPRILDLCAGSGCIGIAVAKAIPTAVITFGEIDPNHVPTIQKNIANLDIMHDMKIRNQIIQSDLFEHINDTYDFILSNPPYIDASLKRVEKSVINYEPHDALFAKHDGLEIIEKIIAQTQTHLNLNGILYLEHEPEQVTTIHTLAKQNNLNAVTHNDQYNVPRYTTFTRTPPDRA